jgi:hypothetical protein
LEQSALLVVTEDANEHVAIEKNLARLEGILHGIAQFMNEKEGML